LNLNNIFGISQRATGKIDENGKITIRKVFSYDLVAGPGFEGATLELYDSFLKRHRLLKNRKEKLNKLNNLNG
jgi:hypothetical protein